MEIALLNVKVTFQKNSVAADDIGNRKKCLGGLLYLPCHGQRGKRAGKGSSRIDGCGF